MVLPFFPPLSWFLGLRRPEEAKNLAGEVLRLIQIRLATPSLERISLAGLYDLGLSGVILHACASRLPNSLNETRCKCESPIPFREMPPAFHRDAQWTASRHRDARLQPKWFVPENRR